MTFRHMLQQVHITGAVTDSVERENGSAAGYPYGLDWIFLNKACILIDTAHAAFYAEHPGD